MQTGDFAVIATQVAQFEPSLVAAIEQLGLTLTAQQRLTILRYLDKLLFWNKAYNLTAINQPQAALVKHIFDCLAILPHLKAGSLLDIGTGAGLPGVIIAICQPERPVTVLDSNQKKIRFIKQCISELGIANVTPVASRIEQYHPCAEDKFSDDKFKDDKFRDGKFKVVTSRAFASLTDFVAAAAPCLASGGYLQAMKGLPPAVNEQEALRADWHIDQIALTVPNLNETRHLIELRRLDTSNRAKSSDS